MYDLQKLTAGQALSVPIATSLGPSADKVDGVKATD
jgi:hypothetical protein